jgi:hypothetical protein
MFAWRNNEAYEHVLSSRMDWLAFDGKLSSCNGYSNVTFRWLAE